MLFGLPYHAQFGPHVNYSSCGEMKSSAIYLAGLTSEIKKKTCNEVRQECPSNLLTPGLATMCPGAGRPTSPHSSCTSTAPWFLQPLILRCSTPDTSKPFHR
ncbi:hypothetical protein PAXRUDRAFT_701335 [Paxillus rubicundulus Ve08.2h10]|uniref:Uncharacterized protein n=1 Tax=Paxillus rubicundulus Ve08.2h10 TaxID=930991 RepID=A0A0D0DTG6_9AGAM|nr:hypothetical protein PAXRUDRAFT_701335 [Paxillus rubicundulus Ve08.2h10]